jgi:hypothetical protein
MQMTFNDYILNPIGKHNAVLNSTAREAMRSSYIKKFDAIMLREHGAINYRLYKNDKKNRFIAHISIPSETVDKFYYDTVIEFYTDKNVEESGTNLFKYNVRFFSNDPSFVYTYAYVFAHNDLFIKELKDKMGSKALKTTPKETNPTQNVGYVKTIYFAYLFMQSKGLNDVNTFKAMANNIDFNFIRANIMNADLKIQNRQDAGEKQSKKEKREATRKNTAISNTINKIQGVIKKTRTTKTTNTTKTTKTSKFTKKI